LRVNIMVAHHTIRTARGCTGSTKNKRPNLQNADRYQNTGQNIVRS